MYFGAKNFLYVFFLIFFSWRFHCRTDRQEVRRRRRPWRHWRIAWVSRQRSHKDVAMRWDAGVCDSGLAVDSGHHDA